uniref:RNA polymerase II subunit B1 CTD phosphatase RPAP2 homolog n=1 Tax=Pandinus cavimanus TaxID=217261 RepID=H2CYS2_PANCV|nr:RNA polymerase II associated protein 2 [Pandinus cavimanus]
MYLRTTIEEENKLLLTKKKQEECKKKALGIVEQMIENPVSEDWLIKACEDIGQSDYDDIVVERFISKLCGYPLCLNPVKEVPRQKYTISTRTNKVYDITERKYFCRPKCYKASVHLKSQLVSTPLWLIEEDQKAKVKLLDISQL